MVGAVGIEPATSTASRGSMQVIEIMSVLVFSVNLGSFVSEEGGRLISFYIPLYPFTIQ